MQENMILQLLLLALLLLVVPVAAGRIFINVDKERPGLPFLWISGQICLWAGFQIICVPMILLKRDFREVAALFLGYMAVLLVLALVMGIGRRRKGTYFAVRGTDRPGKMATGLWILFFALLMFQLIQAVRLAYGDGDDAYYVAVATATESSGTMYRTLAYTGLTTELDLRHGLAPFPIWIAFLARVSGMPVVTVAHVVLPVVLISMAYAVFYLMGKKLFAGGGEQLPLFLVFTEILVLFGGYSFYTVENFVIARSRQGKAALGSLVIPFLIFLLLLLLRKMRSGEKTPVRLFLLLAATSTAGCLCSTLGALLGCMLVGVTMLIGAICYKKWRLLLPTALCCVPCICYALLYILLV